MTSAVPTWSRTRRRFGNGFLASGRISIHASIRSVVAVIEG